MNFVELELLVMNSESRQFEQNLVSLSFEYQQDMNGQMTKNLMYNENEYDEDSSMLLKAYPK